MLLNTMIFYMTALIIFPAYLYAETFEGYLVDSNGYIVTTPFGECVRSGSWDSKLQRQDCSYDLKVAAKIYFDINKKINEHRISDSTKSILNKALDVIRGSYLSVPDGITAKNCDLDICSTTNFDDDENGNRRYNKAISLLTGICEINVATQDLATEVNYLLDEASSYGNYNAMNAKGFLLSDGDLLGYKDFETAFYLFKMAADNGNRSALHNLGFLFENGFGVGRDIEKATGYYDMANKDKSVLRLKNHAVNTGSIESTAIVDPLEGMDREHDNNGSASHNKPHSDNQMQAPTAPYFRY